MLNHSSSYIAHFENHGVQMCTMGNRENLSTQEEKEKSWSILVPSGVRLRAPLSPTQSKNISAALPSQVEPAHITRSPWSVSFGSRSAGSLNTPALPSPPDALRCSGWCGKNKCYKPRWICGSLGYIALNLDIFGRCFLPGFSEDLHYLY